MVQLYRALQDLHSVGYLKSWLDVCSISITLSAALIDQPIYKIHATSLRFPYLSTPILDWPAKFLVYLVIQLFHNSGKLLTMVISVLAEYHF